MEPDDDTLASGSGPATVGVVVVSVVGVSLAGLVGTSMFQSRQCARDGKQSGRWHTTKIHGEVCECVVVCNAV